MVTFFSCDRKSFTEEKWRNTPEEQRGGMANDLVAKNLLLGKALEDVNKMLGNHGYISGYSNTVAYYVGNTGYWGKEHKGIYKCLDLTIENDTVISTRVKWDEWYYELDG